MVVVNSGQIDFCDELNVISEILIMLHLDGLGLHDRREVAANVSCWLNAEYDGKEISVVLFSLYQL
jgi:hypothetical protein